jgi:uncharacterized protein (TIGR02001 family)
MINPKNLCAAVLLTAVSGSAMAEITGNLGVTNNYLWRGLTQSDNEPAISGGIDYANDNGFYVGTWASNVNYGAMDSYSYEHDVYFGYGGEAGSITYDVGYLYYNYDAINKFDFGEVYGSVSFGDATLGAYILTNTEADDNGLNPDGSQQDFGAGGTYYIYGDYGFELENGLGIGLHAGLHEGDFSYAFNGVPDSYVDYSISFEIDGFSFTISDTDLDSEVVGDTLQNGDVKFAVAYTWDFGLGK